MSVYLPKYRDPKSGELKRQSIYWLKFTFAGKLYRESSKCTRKTMAEEVEKKRLLALERAYAGLPTEKPEHRVRSVKLALKEYEDRYGVNHRPKSVAWVKERVVHIERLLGGCLLHDLTEDRIAAYMKQRRSEEAGSRTVNMELECLSRAVGSPWRVLWPSLKRLEEPRDVGRALSAEEEQALLEHAAKSRSVMLPTFIRIALLTGLRFGEIRNLKWSQIDLDDSMLRVGRSKTRAGTGRRVPMSEDLHSTFTSHAGWIKEKLGPAQEGWYVFPFSNRVRPVDPLRPITTIKSSWEAARKAAKVECRFHDLRHTAYTKMIEAGVPEGVIMALMGHVSRAMVERYSHVRMPALREAAGKLSLKSSKKPTTTGADKKAK